MISAPLYANVLLGGPNSAPATAEALAALVSALPAGTTWGAAGIGAFQLKMNAISIFMGGHVRTGLEDNLWFDGQRRRPATNPELVERIALLAGIADRPLATPEQVRERLGIGGIVTLRA